MVTPIYAQSNSTSNMTSTLSLNQTNSVDLATEMKRLESSNDPVDIATFAYIWGFPLISNIRTIDESTDPANYNDSEANGPWNEFHYRTKLADASFTQVVTPNVDTIYSNLYFDLEKQPVVITVPGNINRYYSLLFMDAYTNNFEYIGTRTSGTNEGTYLLTGPLWNGTVPDGMIQINSPTNFGLVFGRTLINGPEDSQEAIDVQQSIKGAQLDVYGNKTASSNLTDPISYYDKSVSGLPEFITSTGPNLFNELAYYIVKNTPPANQSNIVQKFALIGIVPNNQLNNNSATPFNETISSSMLQGIAKGEKLIDSKFESFGRIANGWNIDTSDIGHWADDYLFRAAIAKYGLWANSPEEAVYPNTAIDGTGKTLSGVNNYVIHFGKGELPPVNNGGFWSLTLYNKDRHLHDNPIDRYVINDRTQGLKYSADGSLDIYLQNQKPSDPQKESNWFPSPDGPFSLTMRLYIPAQSVLDGQWSPPAVRLASK